MFYYTWSSFLVALGVGMLVWGLAATFGEEGPGCGIAGLGAGLLTLGLLSMKLAKAEQAKESKK